MGNWKSRLDPITTPQEKMGSFNSALRRVLSIDKAELDKRLEAERVANADKPKRGPKPKTER